MKSYLFFVGMLLSVLGSAQADTYRWVDQAGKVHYGDVPAEEAQQLQQKKFGSEPKMDDADLPYETRVARQKFPVTLYSYNNCGDPCKQGRDFLNKRGIPFSEKSLSTQEDLDSFKKQSGGATVPALTVGKTWLKGFEAGQWGNQLDDAGYPKNASYRSQANSSPSSGNADPKDVPSH
ncbi:MAG: glutaredoxin family protein [Nitrosomonadales bacterium]